MAQAMKRYIILLILPVMFISVSRAQDYIRPNEDTAVNTQYTNKVQKLFIGFSIGTAIPTKDFASHNVSGSFWDFNSTDSTRLQGFAKTGFHFDISATYLFTTSFGIIAQFSDNTNNFDLSSFSSVMGYPAFANTTLYRTKEYLAGPYFSYTATPKLNLDAALLVGLVHNSYPTLTLKLNDTLDYTRELDNSKNVFGFCISAGMSYNLTTRVYLTINIAYTQATLLYPTWTETAQYLSTHPASYYYKPITFYHNTDETFMKAGIFKPTIGIEFLL